jgi:hypothetical protein
VPATIVLNDLTADAEASSTSISLLTRRSQKANDQSAFAALYPVSSGPYILQPKVCMKSMRGVWGLEKIFSRTLVVP